MPSILIEAGFMTNVNEGAYLNSRKGQSEISNSIFKAIEAKDYLLYTPYHSFSFLIKLLREPAIYP